MDDHHSHEEPFVFAKPNQQRFAEIGFEFYATFARALTRDWWKYSGCEALYGPLDCVSPRPGAKPKGHYFQYVRK